MILTFRINSDTRHERVTCFKNIRVTEKISGKKLLSEDGTVGFASLSSGESQQPATSIMVEDQVVLVRRVNNLTIENSIRVEGLITVVKKASTLSRTKEIGPGRELAFETCVDAIIAEDSLETSGVNDSFRNSSFSLSGLHQMEPDAALSLLQKPPGLARDKIDQFMKYQEEQKKQGDFNRI